MFSNRLALLYKTCNNLLIGLVCQHNKGVVMKIKMPTTESVICLECFEEQQVPWNDFGATMPCVACDAAPAMLEKESD